MTPVLMLRSDVTMSGRWKASIIWLSDNCSAIHFHRRDSRHLDQPARLLTQRWSFFFSHLHHKKPIPTLCMLPSQRLSWFSRPTESLANTGSSICLCDPAALSPDERQSANKHTATGRCCLDCTLYERSFLGSFDHVDHIFFTLSDDA